MQNRSAKPKRQRKRKARTDGRAHRFGLVGKLITNGTQFPPIHLHLLLQSRIRIRNQM